MGLNIGFRGLEDFRACGYEVVLVGFGELKRRDMTNGFLLELMRAGDCSFPPASCRWSPNVAEMAGDRVWDTEAAWILRRWLPGTVGWLFQKLLATIRASVLALQGEMPPPCWKGRVPVRSRPCLPGAVT